jgi:hypothetical protein
MFKAEFHKIRWFLASRILIRSYIWLFVRIRIRIIPSTSKKKFRKTLILRFCDFIITCLKTVVNVHSVSDKQRNLTKIYFCIILKATEEKSRIRIRNQVVWIRGSGSVLKKLQVPHGYETLVLRTNPVLIPPFFIFDQVVFFTLAAWSNSGLCS